MSEKDLLIQVADNSFVMFLPPDMESVRYFRKELRKTLMLNSFGEDDISQIILAADEALTNSITANVSNQSEETIICRWRIVDSKFTLFILDYGKGLKISETVNDSYESPKNLDHYLDDIKEHQSSSAGQLPFGGVNKTHKNMGKGLKIIRSLMDTVKILYHNNETITDNPLENKINGSIVELEFNAESKNKN
ncbi:MAG TPA: ATP-binding protein [Leptospiraceae bacterium]|nr:ATP-binding protein [Leptospiraceae bacterium]HMW06398.1 ATP-binding protein [Leptospiraceae bacterium]HMX31690.1 ATP-binding protein [Leptospiraceae bacterium]HMY31976.1 ATP-binding protein [Leptospiraceae bacterium]HMZ63160.1 ATP-binding protein [Leptospiraceae bacterium]